MKKLFVSLLAIFMVLFLASCDPSSSATKFEGTSEEATKAFMADMPYISLLQSGPDSEGTYDFSNFSSNE